MEDKIKRAATAYAKATTTTRCNAMGEGCQLCQVKNCDFLARYWAFECGATFAITNIKENED